MALPWDHLHLPYSPGLTPLVPRIPLGVKVQFSSAGPLSLSCEFFLHQIMNTTNQKPTTRRPVEPLRLGSRGQDISACLCCSGHKVVRATAQLQGASPPRLRMFPGVQRITQEKAWLPFTCRAPGPALPSHTSPHEWPSGWLCTPAWLAAPNRPAELLGNQRKPPHYGAHLLLCYTLGFQISISFPFNRIPTISSGHTN